MYAIFCQTVPSKESPFLASLPLHSFVNMHLAQYFCNGDIIGVKHCLPLQGSSETISALMSLTRQTPALALCLRRLTMPCAFGKLCLPYSMYSTSRAFRAVGRKLQRKSRQAASAITTTAAASCFREKLRPPKAPLPAEKMFFNHLSLHEVLTSGGQLPISFSLQVLLDMHESL